MSDGFEPPAKRQNLGPEPIITKIEPPPTPGDPMDYSAAPQLPVEHLRAPAHSNMASGKSLSDFLTDVKSVTPVIPDSVANYYMRKNGISVDDPRISHLISIATQKFISDIALDCMQSARIQGLGQVRKNTRETRYVLTTELLEPVLEEYGIPFERPGLFN